MHQTVAVVRRVTAGIARLGSISARRRRRPRRRPAGRGRRNQTERLQGRDVVAVPAGPQGRCLRCRSDDDGRRRRRHVDARNVRGRSEGADRLLLRLSDGLDRRDAEQRHEPGSRGEERHPAAVRALRIEVPRVRADVPADHAARPAGGARDRMRIRWRCSARAFSTTTSAMRGSTT